MDDNLRILKTSGELAVFDTDKLRNSLERSGAGDELIEEIIQDVKSELFEGMTTRTIYKKAFSLLRKRSRASAARYKLKRAIIELGPTGYPFERFVGELLKHQGYLVQVGVDVQGHCISHEVDVVAEKDKEHFMIECKFHSDPNRKCGVQVPLYIQSRFLDVKKQWEKKPEHQNKFHQGWVVTNTRFTEGAIKYGNCMGLRLIGWNYPQKGSLKERIDISGLHPVTCLSTLNKKEKQALLDIGIVLCKQLLPDGQHLAKARIGPRKHKRILKEAKGLCRQ